MMRVEMSVVVWRLVAFAWVCSLMGCLPAGDGDELEDGGVAEDAGALDVGEGVDAEACVPGASGCVCRSEGGCDEGLECNQGELCEEASCAVGSEGCPCGDGSSCDGALACVDSICAMGSGEAELSAPDRVVFEVFDEQDQPGQLVEFVNTGDVALTIEGVRFLPSDGSFYFAEVQLPRSLAAGESFEAQVISRAGFGDKTAALIVDVTELSGSIVIELERDLKTAEELCPDAIARILTSNNQAVESLRSLVGEQVALNGEPSQAVAGGPIGRYEWSIVGRPRDSTAQLSPSGDLASVALTPDLPGLYVVDLVVYDREGVESCEPARVTLLATLAEANASELVITVTWNNALDQDQTDTLGADVDMHYLSLEERGRWNIASGDIFWQNATADWGVSGDVSDDPVLEIDDADGMGPERVRHSNPPAGDYYLGLYYYDAKIYGPAEIAVKVEQGGVLIYDPPRQYLEDTNEFIVPAKITVAGDGTVNVVDPVLPVRMGFPSQSP